MKLPTKLKIGFKDYEVVDWELRPAERAERFGECDQNHCIIRVAQLHGDAKAAHTLLHETLHALWTEGSLHKIDAGNRDEELVVSVLSQMLAGLMRDNPGVLALIEATIIGPGNPS